MMSQMLYSSKGQSEGRSSCHAVQTLQHECGNTFAFHVAGLCTKTPVGRVQNSAELGRQASPPNLRIFEPISQKQQSLP